MRRYTKKGFTLIELLVVIGIIGILSAIIFAFIGNSRMKARDARRMAELQQIRTALESYYIDNGQYPMPTPCPSWIYSSDPCWKTLETMLSQHIATLPKDPINNALFPWNYIWRDIGFYSYAYYYSYPITHTGTGKYDLVTQLEDKSNAERCEVKHWKTQFNSTSWCDPLIPRIPTTYTGY